MNGVEFRCKYREKDDYKELAKNIATTVVIRSYNESGSVDTRRKTTKKEVQTIANIAIAAMDTFSCMGEDAEKHVKAICDMAEFTLMQWIPDCNTYDTIYIPLQKLFGVW